MFRFLNKAIDKNPLKRMLRKSGGQAAIILILVIALVLVFYAVSLNFGYFSQIKAMLTTASNTSAAYLASSISSWAQMLTETYLEAKLEKTGWTGAIGAFFTFIAILASMVKDFFTLQWHRLPMKAIGAGAALFGYIIYVVFVNPAITNAWNANITKHLSEANQFTENAIQQGFSKTITDLVMAPDVMDSDRDGVWVSNPAASQPWVDSIPRFAAYYTERINNLKTGPILEVSRFLAALDELLHENCDTASPTWGTLAECTDPALDGQDGWGIHDHIDPADCFGVAECHPCCVPAAVGGQAFRPTSCDATANWAVDCGNASLYGSAYPWVYDPAYENPLNTFYSFREELGKDDEHRLFYKYNASTLPPWNPNLIPQNSHVSGEEGFYLEDTTNFYVPPNYAPAAPENNRGIFPFFHKMTRWGLELSLVDPSSATNPRECHWCNENDPGGTCPICPPILEGPHLHPPEIGQLGLRAAPGFPVDPATLANNRTYHVDGANLSPGNPPLWVDLVSLPTNVFADPDVCAEHTLYPSSTPDGFWKPGMDRYCSPAFPYASQCPKHAGLCRGLADDCGCEDGPLELDTGGTQTADQFPDDVLDGIHAGLGAFIEWAEVILEYGRNDIAGLASNLGTWYQDAARWIEPGPGGNCFLCNLSNPQDGYLHVFLIELTEMRDRLRDWVENTPYVGADCTEVWCVPPASCPLVMPDEELTFDGGATNGVRGDVMDIIECLNHNVNTDGGNAVRFQDCWNSCDACQNDASNCVGTNQECGGLPNVWQPLSTGAYLPRSLVPGFGPFPNSLPSGDYDPVNEPRLTNLLGCVSPTVGCPSCYGLCDAAYQLCLNANHPTSTTSCATFDLSATPPCGCQDEWEYCETTTCGGVAACITSTCDPVLAACQTTCNSGPTDPAACNSACICQSPPMAPPPPFSFICETEIMQSPTSSLAVLNTAAYYAQICASKGQSCLGPDVIYGCGPDPTVPTFQDQIAESALEAENQVVKFEHRRSFLDARVTEANNIIGILNTAIAKLSRFLSGPASNLTDARRNYNPSSSQGLPYEAVYGWKDPDDPDGPPDNGKWHIVKAESRITGYCDNECGYNQTSADPGWPNIETDTYAWGNKRKYYLINYEGIVKFRITRYDEESSTPGVTLPNSVPIWSFKTGHPKKPQGTAFSARGPTGLRNSCFGSTIQFFDNGDSAAGIYDDAFVLNERITGVGDNTACWDLAHSLLSRGATTETCARYEWMGAWDPTDNAGEGGRMDFTFVPCLSF